MSHNPRVSIQTKIAYPNATSNYTFNARNQLVSYEQPDDANQTTKTLEFAYDAFGRRVSKTQDGVEQKYLYDGDDIVAILDSNNQVIATITHDESIDTPLSITNQNGTFYYHRDHQGSIVALTDSSGQVVESFMYDNHYGSIVNHTKTTETNNPYAYTGREYDTPELYYYRARYYDPQIQRFISEDPIGFASKDTNWYRYTWNNPVNLVDHNGLYGTKDCSYYKKVADKTGDFYYKYIGPIACDFFPTQPIFPKWTDCVRLCLQEFDKKQGYRGQVTMTT